MADTKLPTVLAANVTLASNTVVPLPTVGAEVGGTDDLDARLDKLETAIGLIDGELGNVKNDTRQEREAYADDKATMDAATREVDGLRTELGQLREQFNGVANFDSDAIGARLSKVENDTRALMENRASDVVQTPNADLSGFTDATPSFPNGFLPFVIETYFSGELRRYRQEKSNQDAARQAEVQDGAAATR